MSAGLAIDVIVTAVGVLLSVVFAIVVAAIMEALKKPRLTMEPTGPMHMQYENRPAKVARWLSVAVGNDALPRWASWLVRAPALKCRARITFFYADDGQNVLGRTMTGRWAQTPERALTTIGRVGDQPIEVMPLWATDEVDIYPGHEKVLNLVGRFDDERVCYGWHSGSYDEDHPWRDPEWRLPSRRLVARVVVDAHGGSVEALFRIANDVERLEDFRLLDEPPRSDLAG